MRYDREFSFKNTKSQKNSIDKAIKVQKQTDCCSFNILVIYYNKLGLKKTWMCDFIIANEQILYYLNFFI